MILKNDNSIICTGNSIHTVELSLFTNINQREQFIPFIVNLNYIILSFIS